MKKLTITLVAILVVLGVFSLRSYALDKDAYVECIFYSNMFVFGLQDYAYGNSKFASLNNPTQVGRYEALDKKLQKKAKKIYLAGWDAAKEEKITPYYNFNWAFNKFLNSCYEQKTK